MGNAYETRSTKLYRKMALEAARDLGYSQEIIDKIKNADNDREISRIMMTAKETIKEW